MKASRLLVLALLLIIAGLFLYQGSDLWSETPTDAPAASSKASPPAPANKAVEIAAPAPATDVTDAPKDTPPMTREQELAAHREIDKAHMRAIHAGLFAYKAKHGHFPEFLSQLIPEYISADVLTTPRAGDATARQFLDGDHPDPKAKPAYGFEFSNLEFRDGRTFAEIKEVQRAEWGDVVPLLRAFGYDGHVLNMAYSGDFYETQLNWEWDAATLDLVDKLGWGPGLSGGDVVRVQVLGPDGQPVANAQVWADGRNFSFDLPDRSFVTDAEGYVSIPIGVDADRTALALRADAPGMASQAIRLEAGNVEDQTLTLAPATKVSGVVLDASGKPAIGRRVFLRTPEDSSAHQTLAQVVTGPDGRWSAFLHPSQTQSFNAFVAQPGGVPLKFNGGTRVNAAAAINGNALIRE